MLRLSRRTLLFSGGAAAAIGAAGSGFVAQTLLSEGPFKRYVKTIIARRLPYLEIDAPTLERFANDLIAAWAPNTKQRLGAVLGGWGADGLSAIQPDRVDWFERRIATALLLRSNYFDPDKPAQAPFIYVGSPELLCQQANPFAQFD